MKNAFLRLSLPLLAVFSIASCGNQGGSSSEEAVIHSRSLSLNHDVHELASGDSKTVVVGAELGNDNCLVLNLETSIPLLGKFTYSSLEDPTRVVEEEFYIAPKEGEQTFRQLLDAFRPETNSHSQCKSHCDKVPSEIAHGKFSKLLRAITVQNLSSERGSFSFHSLSVTDETVPEGEAYIENKYLKVGCDLMGGGTLTYLERLGYNGHSVDEVVDTLNNVYIGVDAKERALSEDFVLSSHVNLINYYDAGRQFQQSWYADIGGSMAETHGENGYTRTMCYTATSEGYYWPYNPVQGGDVHCNVSQIVDFQRTGNELYVKTRALDWAKNNSLTRSYMENWYTIEGDQLFVKNRFLDWSGFYDMDKIARHTNEIPASYVVHPLNTLVTYIGETPWVDDTTALEHKKNLSSWAAGAYHTAKHTEDWYAWVNDDDFGVGVYVPNAGTYASGRSNASTSYSVSANRNAYQSPMANDFRYNKAECTSPYQSCYVSNCSYTAPTAVMAMKEYVAVEYTYVMQVDYVKVMRNDFRNLAKKGAVDNSRLYAWNE